MITLNPNRASVILRIEAGNSAVIGSPTPRVVTLGPVRGLTGPTATPGPGFRLVGNELRYDIASLPRG